MRFAKLLICTLLTFLGIFSHAYSYNFTTVAKAWHLTITLTTRTNLAHLVDHANVTVRAVWTRFAELYITIAMTIGAR
jgi:hypothetical protein